MRHKVRDKKFNRDSNQRKALLTGLLRNLTVHGEIMTTLAKAKVMKRLGDRMVTQAKDSSLASRRVLHRTFGKRDVVNTLVDRIAPALNDRTSGYVRVIAAGNRRGDNTPMAKVSFVNIPEGMGTLKNPNKKVFAKPEKKAVEKKPKVTKKETK